MTEVWLRPNRRALWFAMLGPLAAGSVGVCLIVAGNESGATWWRWMGGLICLVSLGLIGLLAWQLQRPRVAFSDAKVLFYLRSGKPIAVPLGIVEAFFLGRGPAELPAGIQAGQSTVNLVARLSQREKEWAQIDVKPALGRWCEGYVTIRGMWCEPLNGEVIRRLNRRLKEVQTNA